jgi:hypothetical protein
MLRPPSRDVAVARFQQARAEHQQGGLAGAVRPDQGRHFALGKLRADVGSTRCRSFFRSV